MPQDHAIPEWIAVDWGTSNLRLWAMDQTGAPVVARRSDQGMGRLRPDQFEGALLALCGDLLPVTPQTPVPVLVCGMAGARQGWREVPYAALPAAPCALPPEPVPVLEKRISVHILPGLAQTDPPDVMRGEETQIAGYLATAPAFEGVLCLPGTHSKWVRIAGGEIRQFRTMMTGEIFALLSQGSVLRHSLGDPQTPPAWDALAFEEGIMRALETPEALPSDLFSLRAAGLLQGRSAAQSHARLSGLLIGAELAGSAGYWRAGPVEVIGAAPLAERYVTALHLAGAQAARAPAEDLTLAGLRAAYHRMVQHGVSI